MMRDRQNFLWSLSFGHLDAAPLGGHTARAEEDTDISDECRSLSDLILLRGRFGRSRRIETEFPPKEPLLLFVCQVWTMSPSVYI